MVKKKTIQNPEWTYRTTITFQCPVRGTVTEEVEVKRYGATVNEPVFDEELTAFLTQEGIIEETASLSDLMSEPF